MIVRYVNFRGELVSRAWAIVLHQMEKDLGPVVVNEGHRTIERQQYFWNCYLCQCCNNGNLAARPTPFAPHIRIGNPAHAIDFADPEPVMKWLSGKGLQPSRPAGAGTARWEAWHIEVPLARLLWFARKYKTNKLDTLPKHVEFTVRKFIAARNTVNNRIKDRDSIDSKTHPARWEQADRLVDAAVRDRNVRRTRVEALLKKAKKAKVKRILREVLG